MGEMFGVGIMMGGEVFILDFRFVFDDFVGVMLCVLGGNDFKIDGCLGMGNVGSGDVFLCVVRECVCDIMVKGVLMMKVELSFLIDFIFSCLFCCLI